MKIFNWVHKKLYHSNKADDYLVSPAKDGLGNKVKKTETVSNDSEKTFLQHVPFLDGILTIGTLGYDSLHLSTQQTEYSIKMQENQEEEEAPEEEKYFYTEEERELKPSVVKAFKLEVQNVLVSKPTSQPQTEISEIVESPDMPLLQHPELPEIDTDIKKKRVTLADLLSAELEEVEGKSDSGSATKHVCDTKNNNKSFEKEKHVTRKGDEARPTRKLQRMITKMLKKKIHPEVQGKTHGKGSINPLTKVRNSSMLKQDCAHNAEAELESFLLPGIISQS